MRSSFLAATALIALTSCDPQTKPGAFESGLYVLNEGAFMGGTATLTHWSADDSAATDAFAIANGRTPVEVKINDASQINPNIATERLTEKINSPYDEVNPIISPDGKRLYFGRKFDPANAGGKKDEEDIWYSDWDEKKGEWGIAKNLGSPINNDQPNFMCSITPDGKNVVIGNVYKYEKGKVKMTEGVSMVSIGPDGTWGQPKALKINGYVNDYKKVNFYLCQNRKTMLMAIRADNALGENGTDLYVSFLETDSTWSKPVHAGNVINSVGNESAPFLSADDKTLFFSSGLYFSARILP